MSKEKTSRRRWPFGQRSQAIAVAEPQNSPVAVAAPPATAAAPSLGTPASPTGEISTAWASGARSQADAEWLNAVAQSLAANKERSLQVLGLTPGAKVLDVGCGTGRDVKRLAEIVGAFGEAWGLDNSDDFIQQAQTAIPTGHFQQGDAYHLPFDDHTFDAVRAERVLIHLQEPLQALAEMIRVTKPGGTIEVVEADLENMKVYPCDTVLFQRLITFITRRAFKNPRAGLVAFDYLTKHQLHPHVEVTGGVLNIDLLRADMQRSATTSVFALMNETARQQAVDAAVLSAAEAEQLAQELQRGFDEQTILCTMQPLIVYAQLPVATT